MKKKHTPTLSQQQLSPKRLILDRGRKYEFHSCWCDPDWQKNGHTSVIVVRKMSGEKLLYATYYLDTFCLGLKATQFGVYQDENDLMQAIDRYPGRMMVEIKPQRAMNLIYGAIEYAEDLGFAPHRDFAITRYLINDPEEVEYEEITFGYEGRPLYIAGPSDNIEWVLSQLRKNVGDGNFHFLFELVKPKGEEISYSLEGDADFEALEGGLQVLFAIRMKLAELLDQTWSLPPNQSEVVRNMVAEELIQNLLARAQNTENVDAEKIVRDMVQEEYLSLIRLYASTEWEDSFRELVFKMLRESK